MQYFLHEIKLQISLYCSSLLYITVPHTVIKGRKGFLWLTCLDYSLSIKVVVKVELSNREGTWNRESIGSDTMKKS